MLGRLVDWLIGRLVGWLVDWLPYWWGCVVIFIQDFVGLMQRLKKALRRGGVVAVKENCVRGIAFSMDRCGFQIEGVVEGSYVLALVHR